MRGRPPSGTLWAVSKLSIQDRLKGLVDEYGKIAIGLYFAIFALVYTFFLASISASVGETSTAETVSLAGAAWLATKLTQPLRIGATFVITPLIARLFKQGPTSEN